VTVVRFLRYVPRRIVPFLDWMLPCPRCHHWYSTKPLLPHALALGARECEHCFLDGALADPPRDART
jgi:hypothetical protein